MKKSQRAAFASGTQKNLNTQWKSYILFCKYFFIQPFPASSKVLCCYVEFLSRTFKSVDSIKNYLSGVKLLHLLLEQDCSAFKSVELKLALKGIARLNPHSPLRAKSMTPQLLLKIYQILDKNDPVDITMFALYLVAFFSLLRKSNLVCDALKNFDANRCLLRQDVIVGEKSMLLVITWSKTIQYGKRKLKIPLLALENSALCPIAAYKHMCKQVLAGKDRPAFCVRNGANLRPVTYQQLSKHFKDAIDKTDVNSVHYSHHISGGEKRHGLSNVLYHQN